MAKIFYPCNPPEVIRDVVTLPLIYLVESAVQDIPDQVSLISRFESLISAIRTARIVLTWSPLIPLVFLGLDHLDRRANLEEPICDGGVIHYWQQELVLLSSVCL